MNPEVMFFLPYLGGGGAEMNAVRVSSALAIYRYRVSFAVCRGPGPYAREIPRDVRVNVLDTGGINSSTLRLLRSIEPLRHLLAQQRPALVCPVMDAPSLVVLAAVRQCKPRPRVVLSIQNSLTARYVKNRALRARMELRLIRRLYSRADHIVALSFGVANELQRLVPGLEGRISVIHNAGPAYRANIGAVGSEAVERPTSGRLIVACGRLVEQKGYPYLLRAFARLAGDRDVHLWILGEGPLHETLRALAGSLGVGSRVRFLGFQDDPQLYLRAADVFVLSSLWEGFGNVIVEAMAAGTPVIATDCHHGPGEIIEDGVNGLLVPPADESALAEALDRVLEDKRLHGRLAAGGRARALDFAPENIARQYATVFSNVLSA